MKKRTKKILFIFAVGLIVLCFTFFKVKHISPLSLGLHPKVNQAVFSDKAINGYDPVAYFKQQKALKGKKTISYKWNDATWYFASDENLKSFKSSPAKYAPQFGGYCAFAVSKGFTANADPNVFAILEEKLFLCSEQKLLDEWLKGGDEVLQASQANWK